MLSTNTIKFIYNHEYTSSGNSTPISAGIIIFIILYIVGYLIYRIILKDISHDWENKRCTPRYIFYSGFLKSITGDPIKDTYKNFVDCTNPMKNQDNNKFNVVFDTADTITKTANSIIDYSRDIMHEADRIKGENENKFASVQSKTNILMTTMNELYNYQLKLYTILKMYFERIFLLLDTFSQYTTDIILFKLSNLKYNLSYQGTQLTPFIQNINTKYNNIYTTDISGAVTMFKNIKKNEGDNYENADYEQVLIKLKLATDNYTDLKRVLLNFDKNNSSKLLEIDQTCRDLTYKKISYKTIFPFLEFKLLNPDSFKNQDII
jgi:hypothetical protein